MEGGGREWKLEIVLVRNVLRNNIRWGAGREDFSYKANFLKETWKLEPAHQGKSVNAVVEEYTCEWNI